MWSNTKTGWLMALADTPDSAWGNVPEFYEDILNSPKNEAGDLIIESEVWGKHLYKDHAPAAGDGLAFYHTTRATFGEPDPFKRRPRITLVGEILDVRAGAGQVDALVVAVNEAVLTALEHHPIVKPKDSDDIFTPCGIGTGAVATFYPADAEVWRRILARVRNAVA
jgi:hypothetical protein